MTTLTDRLFVSALRLVMLTAIVVAVVLLPVRMMRHRRAFQT